MASFTEQATLLLNDKSSANIRKVNAELKTLFNTAKKLSNMRIELRGLSQVTTQAKQATTALSGLQRSATRLNRPVNMRVNLQNANALATQLNNLARPRRINFLGVGAGGAGAGVGPGGAAAGGFVGRPKEGLIQGWINGLMRTTRQLALFSIAIGGARIAMEAGAGIIEAETTRSRLRQAGFSGFQAIGFEQTSRDIQKQFTQVPAAEVLNSSVELLSTLRASGASAEDMRNAIARVAENAQVMAITFGDAEQGAENARMLEKISNIFNLGTQKGDQPKIRRLQNQIERAIVAAGGDLTADEAVRTAQQLGSTILLGMSPDAFAKILSVRDEGGQRSTVEVRTAVRDLTRTTLAKGLKRQQAAAGLRDSNLVLKADLAKRLADDPTQFAIDILLPKVQALGAEMDSASNIARVLTTQLGFSTTGAQFFADAIASAGQIAKDTAARAAVDLNPQLANQTIRGATAHLVSAYDTAAATIATGINKPVADFINSFADSMTEFADIFAMPKLVTPADIAARRGDVTPVAPGQAEINAALRAAGVRTKPGPVLGPTVAEFQDALKKLQTAIGTTADGIIGKDTGRKFMTAWDQLDREVPIKIRSTTQFIKDAWQAAGENIKAENVSFTSKLKKAFDILIQRIAAVNWADIGKTKIVPLINAIMKGINDSGIAKAIDLGLAYVGQAFNNWLIRQVDLLFHEQVPASILHPELDPTQLTQAGKIARSVKWFVDTGIEDAKIAWVKIVLAANFLASSFDSATAAVGRFITGLNLPPEGNAPVAPPGTISGSKFWDWLLAGIGVPPVPGSGTTHTPVQPQTAPGPGSWKIIKSWFTDIPPGVDRAGEQLSSTVQKAIDGISRVAVSAGNTVNTAADSAVSVLENAAPGIGVAIGNAAAAAIRTAAATVNIHVDGGGSRWATDPGHVGGRVGGPI